MRKPGPQSLRSNGLQAHDSGTTTFVEGVGFPGAVVSVVPFMSNGEAVRRCTIANLQRLYSISGRRPGVFLLRVLRCSGALPAVEQAVAEGLVIGTRDIAHKDQMVLKALVRLLEGGTNIHARFSETLQECNVVFVPFHGAYQLHADCIMVRVVHGDKSDAPVEASSDLSVAAPLRLTNVIAVLQSATQRVHGMAPYDPVRGLLALFTLLGEHTRTAEHRRAVVPVSSGQQIIFDFVQQLVHTAMPLDVVLSGAYTLGTPHRVSPVEEELIRSVPSHSLRQLLWNLTLRLAQAGAPAPQRLGNYRLLRWPDAVGLAAPGHPRLAALWTHRALSLDQIDAMSGVPAHTARWFLETCLVLGLAVADNSDPAEGAKTNAASPAKSGVSAGRSNTAPRWFGHLRERLKLW